MSEGPDPVPHASAPDTDRGEARETEARTAHADPDVVPMPRWVPVLIGLVLVALAAFAVITGLHYREENVLARAARPPRVIKPMAPAPPGEPGPGSSLVFPGDSAENVPSANAPVTGQARAVITGGGTAGVSQVTRMWARRGMVLKIVPDDALVYVNDLAIGEAKQFNTSDETYDFPAAGSYTVRVTAPGYRDRTFVVTSAESAKAEVARIEAKLDMQ